MIRRVKLRGVNKLGRIKLRDFGYIWVLADDVMRECTWMQAEGRKSVIHRFEKEDFEVVKTYWEKIGPEERKFT